MSGGRSSSTSSNTSITSTDNSNTQINGTEGLVLNFEGAENNDATIIQSDQGAIRESFNFAESALDSVGSIALDSFLTVDNTVDEAFNFGRDALDSVENTSDRALSFGETALREVQEFGRDILEESQATNRQALAIAGNAQTNAFSRIRDIAASFSGDVLANRNVVLLALGTGVLVLGVVFFLRRRRS